MGKSTERPKRILDANRDAAIKIVEFVKIWKLAEAGEEEAFKSAAESALESENVRQAALLKNLASPEEWFNTLEPIWGKIAQDLAASIKGWESNLGESAQRTASFVDSEWWNKGADSKEILHNFISHLFAHIEDGKYSDLLISIEGFRNDGLTHLQMLTLPYYLEDLKADFSFFRHPYMRGPLPMAPLIDSILEDQYYPPENPTLQDLWAMWFYYSRVVPLLDKVEIRALFKIDYAFSRLMSSARAANEALQGYGKRDGDRAKKGGDGSTEAKTPKQQRAIEIYYTIPADERDELKQEPYKLADRVNDIWVEKFPDDVKPVKKTRKQKDKKRVASRKTLINYFRAEGILHQPI